MKTLSINISAISFVFITAVMVFGCKKYERDNPNDILGVAKGSSTIAFNEYKITDDVTGDGKLQKFESGKLLLSLKNIGEKVSAPITQINFSSRENIIVFTSNTLILDNHVLVGRTVFNSSVDCKVAAVQIPNNIVEVTATISMLDGTSTTIKFNVDVVPTKPSKLSITSMSIQSYYTNEQIFYDYTRRLSPFLTISLINNSSVTYNGKLGIGLQHDGSKYSFNNKGEISEVNLSPGEVGTFNVPIGCFPDDLPDNYLSFCKVYLYDKDSGLSQNSFTFEHPRAVSNISASDEGSPRFYIGKPFSVNIQFYYSAGSSSDRIYFEQTGAKLEGVDNAIFEDVKIEILDKEIDLGDEKTIYRITGVFKSPPTQNDGIVKYNLTVPVTVGSNCQFKQKFTIFTNYSL